MIKILTFSSKELPRKGPNALRRSAPLHNERIPRGKGVRTQESTRITTQGHAYLKSNRSSRMWDILTRKAREASTKINRGKDPSLIGFAIESNDPLKVIMSMKNIDSCRKLWRHKTQDPLMVNSQKNDTNLMGLVQLRVMGLRRQHVGKRMLFSTSPSTLSVGNGSPKTLAMPQIRSGFNTAGFEPRDLGSKHSGGKTNRGKGSLRGLDIKAVREGSHIGNKNASNDEHAGAKNSQASNLTRL